MTKYTFIPLTLVLILTSCSKSDEIKTIYPVSEVVSVSKVDTLDTKSKVDTSLKVEKISKVIEYKVDPTQKVPTFEEQEIWTPDGRTQMLIICNEIGECDTVIDLLP